MQHHVVVFISILLTFTNSHKSVTLTPQNLQQYGASLNIASPSEITPSPTQWDITTNSEQTWHLITKLDNSWGFTSTAASTITIEIDTPTPSAATTCNDIIVAFTVPHSNQFIAIRLYMDNTTYTSIITPSCDTKPPYKKQQISGNLSTILNNVNQRLCALGLTGNDNSCHSNYSPMEPSSDQSNSWPIKFILENHPNDYSFISYQGNILQTCAIQNGFDVNQGLEIYFALVQIHDQCAINSIKIEATTPTLSPIYNPSVTPTTSASHLSSTITTANPATTANSATTANVISNDASLEGMNSNGVKVLELTVLYYLLGILAVGCCCITTILLCCIYTQSKRTNKMLNEMQTETKLNIIASKSQISQLNLQDYQSTPSIKYNENETDLPPPIYIETNVSDGYSIKSRAISGPLSTNINPVAINNNKEKKTDSNINNIKIDDKQGTSSSQIHSQTQQPIYSQPQPPSMIKTDYNHNNNHNHNHNHNHNDGGYGKQILQCIPTMSTASPCSKTVPPPPSSITPWEIMSRRNPSSNIELASCSPGISSQSGITFVNYSSGNISMGIPQSSVYTNTSWNNNNNNNNNNNYTQSNLSPIIQRSSQLSLPDIPDNNHKLSSQINASQSDIDTTLNGDTSDVSRDNDEDDDGDDVDNVENDDDDVDNSSNNSHSSSDSLELEQSSDDDESSSNDIETNTVITHKKTSTNTTFNTESTMQNRQYIMNLVYDAPSTLPPSIIKSRNASLLVPIHENEINNNIDDDDDVKTEISRISSIRSYNTYNTNNNNMESTDTFNTVMINEDEYMHYDNDDDIDLSVSNYTQHTTL